jgi:hypothetical protein
LQALLSLARQAAHQAGIVLGADADENAASHCGEVAIITRVIIGLQGALADSHAATKVH